MQMKSNCVNFRTLAPFERGLVHEDLLLYAFLSVAELTMINEPDAIRHFSNSRISFQVSELWFWCRNILVLVGRK